MKLVVRLSVVVGILALVAATAAAQGTQPVRVGGNIQAPLKIKDVAPVYPQDALAANVRGVVILEITVGTDGTVTDAAILRHVALLDQAALDAVRQWVFRPTLLNGAPVPVIMTVTVNFTQSDKQEPSPPPPTTPQVSGVTSNVPMVGGLVSPVPPASRQPGTNPSLPAILRAVKPGYPAEALKAGINGTVSLDVTVDETGTVSDVVVTQSVAALDQVSVEAARQWKFVPSTLNGAPNSMHLAIDFIFTPQGGIQDTVRPLTSAPTASVVQAPPAPPAPGAPLRIGGNIQPPKKLVDVAPVYPADALQAGVQGVVIIEATIGPDGAVTSARVLRSVQQLDQAANDAVRQWRFAPTIVNGAAVPIIMTVTVNFTK